MQKQIRFNAIQAEKFLKLCGRNKTQTRMMALAAKAALDLWPEIDPEQAPPRLDTESPKAYEPRCLQLSSEQIEVALAQLVAEAVWPGANGGVVLASLRMAAVLGCEKELLARTKPPIPLPVAEIVQAPASAPL